jgi:hypothetical protein
MAVTRESSEGDEMASKTVCFGRWDNVMIRFRSGGFEYVCNNCPPYQCSVCHVI